MFYSKLEKTLYSPNNASSIEKNKFQPQLVVRIERLPIVAKAKQDTKADQLTDVEESRVYTCDFNTWENFFLSKVVEQQLFGNKIDEERTGQYSSDDCDERAIHDAYFDCQFIIEEEMDLTENQGEGRLTFEGGLCAGKDFVGSQFLVSGELDIKIDGEERGQPNIGESQNKTDLPLKPHVKSEPTLGSEEGKPLCHLQKSKLIEDTIIKEENFAETGYSIHEEVDIKSEDEGSDQSNTKSAPSQTEKFYYPRLKTVPRSGVSRISTNNLRFHPTEPPIFKCFNCTYQTHVRECMVRHVFRHMKNTLKCPHCSYRTWDEEVFRKHELNHASKEQVKKIHQCPDCSRTFVYKRNLTRHMLKYTKAKDANRYQCPECSYSSAYKKNLTEHMLNHTKDEDAIWYQCLECPYKTKRKGNLTYCHMLIHKKDGPMHKCNSCSYETFQKIKQKRHMRRLHRPKDSPLIHCQEEGCSFKTHHRTYLKRHIQMMHECKTVFKCSKCSYETHYAYTFKAHELGHEDENKWFSCNLCPYKGTSKYSLALHMVVHKSDSDIKWFRCSECAFKSKHRGSLPRHKLIHNINPQKILKCLECSYKTAQPRTFQVHGLKHRKPKEIIK